MGWRLFRLELFEALRLAGFAPSPTGGRRGWGPAAQANGALRIAWQVCRPSAPPALTPALFQSEREPNRQHCGQRKNVLAVTRFLIS